MCSVAAAEVEEMFTDEQMLKFHFTRPISAEDLKHAEDLYLSPEFHRDRDLVSNFLTLCVAQLY